MKRSPGPSVNAQTRPEVERRGLDGVVYVERSQKGSWEDYQRPRSFSGSFTLFCGAVSFLSLWLCIAGGLLSILMLLLESAGPWKAIALVSLLGLAASLAVSLIISLNTRCPLCHGPPLHNRRCRKHRLAQKWPLLTRRATVVLSILFTLHFRCMYCGTPFRLFKKSSTSR